MDERVKEYFKNPRKIIHVKPDTNYMLFITFDNGEIKKYEMINELYGVFEVLKNVEKFESVFIDEVGNVAWDIDENIDSAIHWQNHIDLCKDMLYLASILISRVINGRVSPSLQRNSNVYPVFSDV